MEECAPRDSQRMVSSQGREGKCAFQAKPHPSLSGPWSESQEARRGRLHSPATEAPPHRGRADSQALGSLSRWRVAWRLQAAPTGGRN